MIESNGPCAVLDIAAGGIIRVDHDIGLIALHLEDPFIHAVAGVDAARQLALNGH
ncbi:hypothetical protein D3C71_2201250 [compost metagenome]